MPSGRLGPEVVVIGDDAVYLGTRQVQCVRELANNRVGNPAVFPDDGDKNLHEHLRFCIETIDDLGNRVAVYGLWCGDPVFGGKISQHTSISCRKYDLYRGKQGCGMVRGKMPILRKLCIGLYRRNLSGNHVCQGSV